jgi:heme oxygenase
MTTISQLMRESSMSDHKSAENASFIKDLMAGELSAADYTRYLNQMIFVYQAMEAKLPDAAPLPFAPELKRLDSMVSDLATMGSVKTRQVFTTSQKLKLWCLSRKATAQQLMI